MVKQIDGNGNNTKNRQARTFYEYLKTLPFVEVGVPRYNEDTDEAIKEARSGRTSKTTLEDFRKELYS